jgi:hypothetical protein
MSNVPNSRATSLLRGRVVALTAVTTFVFLSPACSGDGDTQGSINQSATPGTTTANSVTPPPAQPPAVTPTGTVPTPATANPPGQQPPVQPGVQPPTQPPAPNVNPQPPITPTPPPAGTTDEEISSGTSEPAPSGEDTGATPGPVPTDTELVGIESPGANCVIPDLGEFDALESIDKLPDPFVMMDGTPVTTRAQWVCRRAEISAMIQKWEAGIKPAKPAEVTGAKSGNGIEVTVSDGAGKTMKFSASISLPTGGTGPYPAMIGLAGGSLPANTLKNLGVATINFGNDQMGNQSGGRGTGQFFDFNGKVDAGALLAWAWGVSRLIDALEVTPDANIDTKHLGITGCSRNGKGALMIGAMDARIALTVPQESGSGGVASWRVSEEDDGGRNKVQTMKSAHTEQPWFANALGQFTANVDKIPIDHHELIAMVAPRGLLGIGNPQYEWLGINSSDQAMHAARTVYEALGAKDALGYQESSHAHCSYAQDEIPALEAYVKKFLLDQDVSTDFWKMQEEFAADKWAGWETPNLQ